MPDESLRVPAFCPNCGDIMRGKSTFTYYDYGCCVDCYIYWLEGRPEKVQAWRDGWRPTAEEIKRFKEFMKN